jgi:hypothetical protein
MADAAAIPQSNAILRGIIALSWKNQRRHAGVTAST